MSRGLKIAVTVVGTLLGLWLLLAGSQKFFARAAFEQMFADFSLPLWAVPVIGVFELAGAVLVFIPRTAMYGAAVIAAVMVGAASCHLLTGTGSPVPALVALLMAAFVGGVRFRAQRHQLLRATLSA